MIKGILARTSWKSRVPLIDDLSHHMLIIASASLQMTDNNITIASLIHDFFKGLMLWYPTKNGWNWWHFSRNKQHYFEIFEDLKYDIKFDMNCVAEMITEHHDEKCSKNPKNPIRKVECSKLVEQIESKLFLLPEIITQGNNFLKLIPLKLSGKYRLAVASILHGYLTKYLSKAYADRFENILNFRTIRYIYTPIEEETPKLKSWDDALKFVNELDLRQFKLKISDNRLDIRLPVIKNFENEFFIEYNDEETTICIENGKIVGIKVSYGDALSTLVVGGIKDGALIYVDSGFEIDLKKIISDILSWLDKKKVPLQIDDLEKSIEGAYSGNRACVFCGETTNTRFTFGNRFTDTHQMLFSGDYVCPTCLFGFFLEDQRFGDFQIPQPAYILKTELQTNIPIKNGVALSVAGNFWLKVLSELWFDLVSRKDGYKYVNQILNPKYLLSPLVISYAPQFMYPTVKGSGSGKKKFILESSLRHGVVCWGLESDLTIDEFSEIVRFVEDHEDKVLECLRALKYVYSINVLPNPPKRGGRGVRKSRKRRSK